MINLLKTKRGILYKISVRTVQSLLLAD